MKKTKAEKAESILIDILASITGSLIKRFKLRGIVVITFKDGKFDILHDAKDEKNSHSMGFLSREIEYQINMGYLDSRK